MNARLFSSQEHSPYLDEVNRWIMEVLQRGFHMSWISHLMPNATNCKGLDKIIASRGGGSAEEVKYTIIYTKGSKFTLL